MTPRTQKQFKEIREEKIALIMDAALKQFADEGYHNTTISQIAKRVGISKGLIYNYFRSKEELLNRIISRSMEEIFRYFIPADKGYLSQEEFEVLIRTLFNHIRENLSFWRLFYQLLLQKDVRDQFLQAYTGGPVSVQKLYTLNNDSLLIHFTSLIKDYFIRKKDRKPAGYDFQLDMNMFFYTIEGFTIVNAYLDVIDEYYDKAINKIIELYK